MAKQEINEKAPEFALASFQGETVSLHDFQGRKNVILVFNRGFM